MNNVTRTIYKLVSSLPTHSKQPLGTIELSSAGKAFLELDNTGIKLCGEDIAPRIIAQRNKHNSPVLEENWRSFLEELGDSYVRLNHLGISYACDSYKQEISYHKKIVSECGLDLYEEPSNLQHERWLFIGNTSDWQDPLFEIVLTEDRVDAENEWRPHFQIDIDTKLTETQLKTLLAKHFGPEFTKWQLTFPNYGTVMSTGLLGIVEGTKIFLATGTSLRNTQYTRQQELKRM